MTMNISTPNPDGPVVLCIKQMGYAFPFGIGYLAGYLKERGRQVIVEFWPDDPKEYPEFARKVHAHKPLLVGFGSLFPDLYIVRKIIPLLNDLGREYPAVIGGQMVSPTPAMAVKMTGADIGVIDEGEIILHELVEALAGNTPVEFIKGLVVSKDDGVVLTGPGDYIQDMSTLPPIPYELFPLDSWFRIGKFYTRNYQQPHWRYHDRVVSIHGGRGCPYNCNFCYHHSKARYRKLEEMVEETVAMTEKYDANMVYFGDDLVLATPKRAKKLTELLSKLDRKIEYSVSCRFDILDRIDDDLLREMKRTGCRIMGLGIESGTQRILDIMNKRITLDQVRRGLGRLKNVGILPTVSIMVGQVSETADEVENSIRLMRETVEENKCIQYAFTIATPFPGSDMFDHCVKTGLLEDEYDFFKRFDPDWTFSGLTVNASAMDDETLLALHDRIWQEYREAKEEAMGSVVPFVEGLRGKLAEFDERHRNGHEPSALYRKAYDMAQVVLDKTRLAMLGL